MSEWLELLFDAVTHWDGDCLEADKAMLLRWVHEAIKERNSLLQKLNYQLDAHEAIMHANAHLRQMEKVHAAEIHKLKQQIHDEEAGRT